MVYHICQRQMTIKCMDVEYCLAHTRARARVYKYKYIENLIS